MKKLNLQPPEITEDTPGMIWNGAHHATKTADDTPRWEIICATVGNDYAAIDLFDHASGSGHWVATVLESEGNIKISTGSMRQVQPEMLSAWNAAMQWVLETVVNEMKLNAARRARR